MWQKKNWQRIIEKKKKDEKRNENVILHKLIVMQFPKDNVLFYKGTFP